MLNITIVEDHRPLRESLVDAMANEGHEVTAFGSAEALWRDCSFHAVDILILDLNLPGEDGIAVARRVRAEYPSIGIVMLTARDATDERRVGYESGADIYLPKPSSAMELGASVKALARRLKPVEGRATELVLDTCTMTLSGPKQSVGLSAWEVGLLNELARSPDRQLGTEAIVDLIDRKGDINKAAVEVRIVRLRKKMISAGATDQPIKSIRKMGYRLSSRVRVV